MKSATVFESRAFSARRLLIAALAALFSLLIPATSKADVHWFNDTSNELHHVHYIRESTMFGEAGTFYETSVVQPGFTLNLYDYEGASGNVYYYLQSVITEPVSGGSGADPAGTTSDPTVGFFKGPNALFIGSFTDVNRTQLEAKVANALGIASLNESLRRVLDQGCVGLVKLALSRTINGKRYFPPTKYPEDASVTVWGELRAFLTYEDSQGWVAGPGQREVVYIKFGAWKYGGPPSPIPGGISNEVPTDSVINQTTTDGTGTTNNYIVKMGSGTEWLGASAGVSNVAERPQMVGRSYPSINDIQLNQNTNPHIFLKRITPESN